MRNNTTGGLVYSTDGGGRMCPACRQPIQSCRCKAVQPARDAASRDGIVRVSLETKGRGGKAVTIVRGIEPTASSIEAIGKQLRSACGSGGTVKDGVVEIQGDHRDKVVAMLNAQGMKVKRSGG